MSSQEAAPEPAARAAAPKTAPIPTPTTALAPAPAAPKAPSIDAKTALLRLQQERNGPSSSAAEAAESNALSENGHGDDKRGSGSGDWLMAIRPSLKFPPFPGVTEDMGVISREYVSHFYCPFVKKQGITYAATGYEAVAPVTVEVEDNWAECDLCQKWRRLPGAFVVSDGAPFQCKDADRSCEDCEDDWNDEDELEIENEKGAVLNSALQNLEIEGLEVLDLGRIEMSKGYWSERHVFPVSFRARRSYLDTGSASNDTSEMTDAIVQQYECLVEMGDNGPVFCVTPVAPDGQLLVERRAQGDTASKAWASIVAAREGGGGIRYVTVTFRGATVQHGCIIIIINENGGR